MSEPRQLDEVDLMRKLEERTRGKKHLRARAEEAEARFEAVREAACMSSPWCLPDVLDKLLEAAHILMREKDYDGDGWERIDHAMTAARGMVPKLREALARLPE